MHASPTRRARLLCALALALAANHCGNAQRNVEDVVSGDDNPVDVSANDARPATDASDAGDAGDAGDVSPTDAAGPESSLDAAPEADTDAGAPDTAQPGMDAATTPDGASPSDSATPTEAATPTDASATDGAATDAPVTSDAAVDVLVDVPVDAALDVGADVSVDVAADVPVDAPVDAVSAPEAGPEAAVCSGSTPDTCGSSCVDLQTDLLHCGSCSQICSSAPPNAHPTCASGVCGSACTTGWADCNTTVAGCETPVVGDESNCGACGHVCPTPANGVALCVVGFCQVHCSTGYADCDRDPSNGCEVSLADGGSCAH